MMMNDVNGADEKFALFTFLLFGCVTLFEYSEFYDVFRMIFFNYVRKNDDFIRLWNIIKKQLLKKKHLCYNSL